MLAKGVDIEKGYITCKMKGDISAVYWMDRGKCILSTICSSPKHQFIMWAKKGVNQNLCALKATIRTCVL
jgi:hypothetical protein